MDRLISEQAVLNELDKELYSHNAKMAIKAIPAAEPKEGHWIGIENEEMETIGYYCSKCDLPMETEEQTDYCPNCGARMVESQKRSDKE